MHTAQYIALPPGRSSCQYSCLVPVEKNLKNEINPACACYGIVHGVVKSRRVGRDQWQGCAHWQGQDTVRRGTLAAGGHTPGMVGQAGGWGPGQGAESPM